MLDNGGRTRTKPTTMSQPLPTSTSSSALAPGSVPEPIVSGGQGNASHQENLSSVGLSAPSLAQNPGTNHGASGMVRSSASLHTQNNALYASTTPVDSQVRYENTAPALYGVAQQTCQRAGNYGLVGGGSKGVHVWGTQDVVGHPIHAQVRQGVDIGGQTAAQGFNGQFIGQGTPPQDARMQAQAYGNQGGVMMMPGETRTFGVSVPPVPDLTGGGYEYGKSMKKDPSECACPHCGMTFKNDQNLKRHLLVIHQMKHPFQCTECSASYNSRGGLKLHYKAAHFESIDKVENITKMDIDEKKGQEEILPKEEKCDIGMSTGATAGDSSTGDALKMQKTVSKRSTCRKCHASFPTLRQLERHTSLVHDRIKPFVCRLCNQRFGTRQNLHVHISAGYCTPQNAPPYGAIDDRSGLVMSGPLGGGVLSIPGPVGGAGMSTLATDGGFSSNRPPYVAGPVAMNHSFGGGGCVIDNAAVNDPYVYQGPSSGNLFVTDAPRGASGFGAPGFGNLGVNDPHANISVPSGGDMYHSPTVDPAAQKIQCNECGAFFRNAQNLTRHIHVMHDRSGLLNKRQLECSICMASFASAKGLNDHKRKVHRISNPSSLKGSNEKDERSFKCSVCGDTFKWKGNLVRHKKLVHEKTRPFKCDQCGSSFGTKSNMQVHKLVHLK